jgi:hypothetical protein
MVVPYFVFSVLQANKKGVILHAQCNLDDPVPVYAVPSHGRSFGRGVRPRPAKPTCFTRSQRYLDVRYFGRLAGRSRSACTRFECVYSGSGLRPLLPRSELLDATMMSFERFTVSLMTVVVLV